MRRPRLNDKGGNMVRAVLECCAGIGVGEEDRGRVRNDGSC
jgi:hypothetical protein